METRIDTTAIARALEALGADLFETVDTQEAEEAVGPDSYGDDTYTCLGQTDTRSNTWAIRSTPERAEIVDAGSCANGQLTALFRALGWREVPDSYIQSHAFFLPEEEQ